MCNAERPEYAESEIGRSGVQVRINATRRQALAQSLRECVLVKVREMIAQLESHGWYQVAQTGSHRQFKHPVRQGRVTVAGRESLDLTLTTLRSIYRQAGLDWSGRKR